MEGRDINLKLKEAIEKNRDGILKALEEDLGKSESEALLTEYLPVMEELNLYIKRLSQWKEPKRIWGKLSFLGCKSYTVREPYGKVLVISPWNYPFQLAMLPIIGALGGGNTVVLKPSELSKKTEEILKKIVSDADIPELKIVTGDYLVAEKLLKEKFDYIFFTGSTGVGKIVYEAAAKNLTPVTLELGGKSPAVIEPDSNFTDAVEKILWGKFLNSGQTCIAPDYVYIPKGKITEFLQITENYIKKYGGTKGKIINERHYSRLVNLLNEGQTIYREESENENDELFFPLHIVLNPNEESSLMKEEIFGPILPILEYESLEFQSVYEIIRKKPKPLALYIFRKNRKNIETYGVSSGGLCINGTIFQVAESTLPFGGVGESGIGSYHGKKTFETFTHEKSVMETSFIKRKYLELANKFK